MYWLRCMAFASWTFCWFFIAVFFLWLADNSIVLLTLAFFVGGFGVLLYLELFPGWKTRLD